MAEFYNNGDMAELGRNTKANNAIKKLSKTTRNGSPLFDQKVHTPLEDKLHQVKRNNYNVSSRIRNTSSSSSSSGSNQDSSSEKSDPEHGRKK